jgi:hypothetical protein
MPIVKKLKYDLEGTGVETEIKISINSKGEFSADVPMYVRAVTHKTVTGLATLNEAINLVKEIVREFQEAYRTEKMIIIIEFKKDKQPFINSGVCMKLNYIIANKKEFGKSVNYKFIEKDKQGNFREVGNYIPTSRFANNGVVAGESLEIDYTEEVYKTIEDLHFKLENLCSKLSEICNNENQLMQLVGNNLNLLGN